MKLTILFDLDGTLLSNQVETFLPAYINLLSNQLADWPADQVKKHLLSATGCMVNKSLPEHTLEEVFNRNFYPGLGTSRDALQPKIDHFYQQVYPTLQKLTRQESGAKELVTALIQKGHDLAIATNPVFPATAIHQRLEWAGFPTPQDQFRLISNFSDFHFSKPHPAFYAEILARLGWLDQPAVMVGDSLSEDILPAAQLGLPVFWINKGGKLPEGVHPLSRSGSLSGVMDWIESIETSPSELRMETKQAVMAVLMATPAALDHLFRSLPATNWIARPAAAEWCLIEIVCHLRDVDREVNLPRLELITRVDEPFLPGIPTDDWAAERKYCQQDGIQALAEFMSARTKMLGYLQELGPEDWRKPARHAIFGPTHLLEMMSFISTHDRNHIQQAFRSVSI